MNKGAGIYLTVLTTIILWSLASAYYTSIIGSANFHVVGQEGNSSAEVNETKGTGPAVISKSIEDQEKNKSNLSRGELDPVLNQLFKAREELLHDNLVLSLDAMNNASAELFRINISLAETGNKITEVELTPLQRQIEYARAYVLNTNSSEALRALNGADTQFIIIAQELDR